MVCHRCNKRGHYQLQCFTKHVSTVTSDGLPESTFLDTLNGKHASAWFCTVELNKKDTQFKLDTGAGVTAISEKTHSFLQKPLLTVPDKILYGLSRQPLKILGQFKGTFRHKGVTAQQPVYLVNGLKINLLGLPAITAMKLACRLSATVTDTTTTTIPSDIKQRFPSLFRGLGNISDDYEIRLKPGAIPYSSVFARNCNPSGSWAGQVGVVTLSATWPFEESESFSDR